MFSHTIAASPLESNVLFGVLPSGELMESDDGGVTWPFDLKATANALGRPTWVRTRQAMDGNPAHFDLHFAGRVVTCTNTPGAQRCPSNAGETWPRVPDSALNWDISGVAFVPGSPCPRLMSADFGVFRAGPAAPGAPCGLPSAWTHVGKASTGLHSLQIYQLAGQLQYPITGSGISITGSTRLFMGTQDNMILANYDAGATGWQGFWSEGSFLQVLYENPLLPPTDLQLTFFAPGTPTKAMKMVPIAGGSWSQPVDWTTVTPPGNAMPPVLIGPHTYVQWSGASLFLTTDGGVSFTITGQLPANPADPAVPLRTTKFGSTQVTRTPLGPALYDVVEDGTRNGLALLSRILATPTPRIFEIRTFGGLNLQGFSSGLTGITSHGHEGSFYRQPVFAVDPNDYRNLIAADKSGAMVQSSDAGRTWQTMIGLTSFVTLGGALSFIDARGDSQARAIAYDPGNSQHVLVGTDQAGIMASANGGITWSALPGTTRATAITSFFFDDRTNVVYVATYGRGLWKLSVDWSTVGKP